MMDWSIFNKAGSQHTTAAEGASTTSTIGNILGNLVSATINHDNGTQTFNQKPEPRTSNASYSSGYIQGHICNSETSPSVHIRAIRLEKELKMLQFKDGIIVSIIDSKDGVYETPFMMSKDNEIVSSFTTDDTSQSVTPLVPCNKRLYTPTDESDFIIDISIDRSKCVKGDCLKEPAIRFSIYPMANFPFCPPYVQCHTKFCFPSIADGRNILSSVIQEKWSPSITFTQIISALPQFIDFVIHSVEVISLSDVMIGTFPDITYLGRYVDSSDVSVIPCLSFSKKSVDRCNTPRFVILTESILVQCKVVGTPTKIVPLPYREYLTGIDKGTTQQTAEWQTSVNKWIFLGTIEQIILPMGGLTMILKYDSGESDTGELVITVAKDITEIVEDLQENLLRLGKAVDVVTS